MKKTVDDRRNGYYMISQYNMELKSLTCQIGVQK